MKLSKYFVDNFLTVRANGGDNCVFTNCPDEVLKIAQETLEKENEAGIAHIIPLSNGIVSAFGDACEEFEGFYVPILARGLVNGLVMKSLIESKSSELTGRESKMLQEINQGLEDMLSCDSNGIIHYLKRAPLSFDISNFVEKNGRHEIVFILRDMKDRRLQQAVNNFLSERSRYVVKVFSDSNLASCLDEGGNLVQCPHDYVSINIKHFIENENQK